MKYYICAKCKKTFISLKKKKRITSHCNMQLRDITKEQYKQNKLNKKEYKKD